MTTVTAIKVIHPLELTAHVAHTGRVPHYTEFSIDLNTIIYKTSLD